jgi:hypothetical protein
MEAAGPRMLTLLATTTGLALAGRMTATQTFTDRLAATRGADVIQFHLCITPLNIFYLQEIRDLIYHPAILRRILNNHTVIDATQTQTGNTGLVLLQPAVLALNQGYFDFTVSHDLNL